MYSVLVQPLTKVCVSNQNTRINVTTENYSFRFFFSLRREDHFAVLVSLMLSYVTDPVPFHRNGHELIVF